MTSRTTGPRAAFPLVVAAWSVCAVVAFLAEKPDLPPQGSTSAESADARPSADRGPTKGCGEEGPSCCCSPSATVTPPGKGGFDRREADRFMLMMQGMAGIGP